MLKTYKLKEISKLIGSGITPLRSNPLFWNDGIIPWLKTEQLGENKIYNTTEKITQYAIEKTSIKIFPVNTLSIAMYGEGRTRGNVSILKAAMTTNQACCNLVIDSTKADYEYVYYFLKTQYQQLRNLSSGVRKNLNSNDIKEFEIRLPENLSSQQKIASLLSSLDSKIELNNRINVELEGMAKLIYDYWFVQFDFPDANGKPYKTSGGKMVWNKELKREIPEGWEVKKIGDVSEIKAGGDKPKAISKVKTSNCQVPIYSNGISDEGLYGYTENAKIFSNSITISARGTIGYSVIRLKPYVPIIRLITVIPNNYYELNFLYQEIQRLSFEDSGSVQKQLTVPQISELKVVMPSIELIKKYHQLSFVGLTKIDGNKEENQKLSELRDWLLPMLMNGQVRVRDNGGEMGKNQSGNPT